MGITAVMLPEQILLGIGFFSSGLLFFLLVWLILRTGTQGQQQTKLLSANYPHFNAKNQQDATFVIEIGGRIQSMSDSARELFELGPGDFPNIERLVEKVQPVEIFLEICATEGQARFLVNGKKIKAGSYRVPAPVPSMLLVLHTPETEITSSQIPPENHQDTSPDLLALPVLPITASLNLDETVESILHRAAQLVHMDFIEIKTWDETSLQITNIFRGEVTKGGTHSVKREKTSIFGNYTKKLVSEQKEFAIADTSILNATPFDPTNQSLPSMGSYIGVPLLLNDKLVGTLEAGVLHFNGFEPIASRVLLTFTQAAAAALNNAAAFETQLKMNKQLIDLTNLAQKIGSIRDINTSVSLIVSHLAINFDFEMIGILLYDPQHQRLEAQMPFRGLPDNIVDVYKISIKPNSSMEKIIAEQKSINTGDASLDSRWADLGLQDMALAASIRDTILYPLTSAGTFLGYIQLSNTHQGQRSVSKNEQQLLEMIAVQIGIIIENALLLKKEQLRSQRVESIHQVNAIVISSAKLDEILQKALEQTGLLFQADAGAIFIVDEVAGVMQAHVPSAFGVPEELIRPLSRINIKPAAFQLSVAGSQISFISGNLSGDRRVLPIYRAIVRKLNLISAIVVPLIFQGKSIGEMMLGSQKGDHFNDEDLKIAGTIAGQLAAAIQTTRHSGETDALLQRRSNYLTAMNRITREINSAANLEDLARIVYDECLLITGAACGTISIFTGNSVADETLTPQVIHKGHSEMETIPEIAREALNSGETRLVSEFSKTEPPHNDIQSVLFCPIYYQGENFGLIELHAQQVDCFDEISIEMTRNIGAQTALAAGNILRYQQQQNRSTGFHQRAEMLMDLFDTSRKPGFGSNLEKSLESLARKIQKITAYNQIQISLYTPQTDLLTNIMSMGTEETSFSNKQNQPQTWKNISSLLKKEFRSGSLTILSGTSFPAQTSAEQAINETLGTEKNYRAGQPGTTILIPLFDPDQNPLGLISLENPHISQQPDRATQEILEIFASETAALIATNLNTQKFQNKIQVLEQEVERQKKNFNFSQQSLPVLLQKDLEHTIELSELIQRARHIRASLQVTETISRQIDTNMALSILGQQILTSFDMSLAIVARETAEGPQIAHITGILPDGTNPATSFGQRNPLRTCMQTGAAMVIENLDEDETWRDNPFLTNLRAKSFFCIPIIINQKPIAAVLAIDTDVMPTLSDEDRQVYNQAGRQISIILQNISLLNETRQRLQEVNLLLDFNRRLNGLNPHEIMKSLLDSALRVVNQAHAGFVLMWEQHAEVLVPVAVANYGNDKNLMQISYRSGEGLPGQVFEDKKPRRVDEVNFVTDYNLQPENLLKYRQATGGRLPVSSLIMPIMTTGNNWGILVLDNFNTPAAFRTEDEAILLSLCQQVALSLENVHLMQASQERAGQLQALNSVAATLTANLQREELLSTLLDRMASIIPYDTAILWLRQENKMVVKDARGFDDNEERKGLSVQVDESVLLNEMTRTGQAIVVNDVRNDPRFTSLNQPRYLDWMGIPLMAKGQVIGVLALEKTEAYFYSNDLMQLSATFASQATVAIDNATLFEESTRRAAELDERSQRLGMLNTFSAELGGSLSSEQVLSLTATQLMTALQIEKAMLLLLGDNNHDYLLNILPDEAGKTNTQRELPSSEILNHLREAQSIYAVEDVSQDPSLASLSALLENSVPQERFAKQIGPNPAPQELGPTSEAMLILPLSSSKNHYAIVLYSRQIRRFNSTEIELARTICNQATIALENADLYQSTLSTAKRLTILNQVSYAIGTSLKAEDIYRAAHEATTKLMPVEAFVIALLDDERHDVEGAYMIDMGERIEGMRLPYGQGLSGQVIATGQPIRSLHPLDSEAGAHGAIIIGKQGMPNSILAVPMLSGGKAIGMLSTQSYQFNAYTEDDQQILSTLANQVTVALLNARLLNETQNLAATLEQRVTERTSQLNHEQHNTETLLRVLTDITASLDLDHAL
ncbi:MAG: GAF domain-containing protein, partial [Chloroflexota bacterium]